MHGWQGWAAIIASVVSVTVAVQFTPPLIAALEFAGTDIQQVDVIPSPADRQELTLAVRAAVYVSDRCARVTHFALVNAPARVVYPVGQIASGRGFSAPWQGAYMIRLSVPSAIAAGRYILATRALYSCSWGPLAWSFATQADPVPVVVP